MSELWSLPAGEVAPLVRNRKVSAREVADSSMQRLDYSMAAHTHTTHVIRC
jgi:hypothetical protein